MKVRDVMKAPVITVHPSFSYASVARLLFEKGISGAPVVDDEGKIVGMVSEKDLYRVLYPRFMSFVVSPELYVDSEARETKVADIEDHLVSTFMVHKVITISPDVSVMHAGAVMLAKQIHRLPVVEHGQLVGMITRHDLFRATIEEQLGT